MSLREQVGRRQFLGFVTWVLGGLITAVYAIPGLAYLLGPALQRAEQANWLPLASISKVEIGTPALFKTTVERKAGWVTSQEELAVYVLTENGREFIAMSNICTHLGCRVRWISEREIFFCPCHNGVFDKDGAVLDGPPPRPLDRFEVKVDNDQLFILGG